MRRCFFLYACFLGNVQEIARTIEMSEFLVKEYIAIIEEHNKKEEKVNANGSV